MFSAPHAQPTPRSQQFAGAYRQVGVQTMVAGASPHGLVALLFEDVAAKGLAIGQAVRIIDEGLKSALDLKDGGKLAADLSDLYSYVCMRLTQANLRNDEAALDECAALLTPLRDAWAAIGTQVDATAHN